MIAPISGKMDLTGRVAVVTGGASGIGQAIVKTLTREGAKVAACDIQPIELEVDSDVCTQICDITSQDQVRDFIEKVIKRFNKIDILITSAGICTLTDITELSLKEFDKMLDVNLKGTFIFCQEVYGYMKQHCYGKIVCIGSIAGKSGGAVAGPHYVASKGAVHSMVKWLARNGADYGIYANGIAPGPVKSSMTQTFPYKPDEFLMKRLGEPEDIAEAAVFLSSQASNWITGQIIDVNGGQYIGA